jgi:hypothetical protein
MAWSIFDTVMVGISCQPLAKEDAAACRVFGSDALVVDCASPSSLRNGIPVTQED